VGGSNPDGKIGHSAPAATLLTKVACQHVVGLRPDIKIFGTDYDTPDGTGVRDYIHVEDLAAAHLDALRYLRNNGESTTLNVGYGRGFSVRDVLSTVGRISGQTLNIVEEPRRPGDPATLVAKTDRVRSVLGWKPRFDNLEVIAATQLAWERHLQQHPELLKK
jgi:UDP-glucose 4-epimerase